MYCCSNCFAHRWIKNYVRQHSDVSGTCGFCDAEGTPLLSTEELTGAFRNLLSMYIVSETFEGGEQLLWLIQWRWQVFNDDLHEDKQAALLEDIANSDWDDDDGEPMLDATELYMPKSAQWFHDTHSDTWEHFCTEVRGDPHEPIPFDEFMAEELAESEEILPTGTVFFRARTGFALEAVS